MDQSQLGAWRGAARCQIGWRTLGRDLAYGYRLRSDGALVSGQRALVYTVFGYAMAAQPDVRFLLVNTAVIGLLFTFFGAYDNYWDWRLLGESNAIGKLIEEGRLSSAAGLLLVFAPWLVVVPMVCLAIRWGMSGWSQATLWLMTALGLLYVSPGIRLKAWPLSFFVAPVWACLLFVQAFLLTGRAQWTTFTWLLCGVVFGLQCQAELLHRLDDHLRHSGESWTTQRLLTRLRRVPSWTLGASLVAAFSHPLLLNTSFWSVVRLQAIKHVTIHQISKLRRQFWHPLWSLYEFAVYAVVGLFSRAF